MDKEYAIAPKLDIDGGAYAEFYVLRKNASTMTQATIEWFHNHVDVWLREVTHENESHLPAILSVGSGEGDIDIEIIKAIQPYLGSKKLKYDALEPNLRHYERFLDRINRMPLDASLSLAIYNVYFDQFSTNQQYDVVLLIHVLYYFDDPYQAIRQALRYTKPGGRVVIIHQSSTGIPEIQRKHMYKLKSNVDELFTTDDIKKSLDNGGEQYRFFNIDAHLEVTECLKRSEVGLKIMSFCMECDLSQIDKLRLNLLAQSFSDLAVSRGNGKSFIYEPLGAFIVDNPKTKRLPQDRDCVEDYRQLAQKFEWSKTFLDKKNSNIRVLDVGCGTGRWLQAFLMYVTPQLPNLEILYDLVDPSEQAMSQALVKIEHPLKIGHQYIDTIQQARLDQSRYDIIWSMHAFYAIPRPDLPHVLGKISNHLNDQGQAFIAQATKKSFYVRFYDKFLETFHCNEAGFTSAEDIVAALNMLGLEYQVYAISYDECIAEEDLIALEHYIMKESASNSFRWEDVSAQEANREVGLQDVLNDPSLGAYLRSFIKESMYCFTQEIWLISFGKKENGANHFHNNHKQSFDYLDKNKQNSVVDPLLPDETEMRQLVDTAMKFIVQCQLDTAKFPLNGSGFKWVHTDDFNREYEDMLTLAKTVEAPLPEDGEPHFEKILHDLFFRLTPYSTNDNSGGYLAYVPGGGLFHAALADFISLSLNRYVTMFMAAPGLAAIEEQVIRWLCDIVGFSNEAGGVITSGGSTATFVAIHTARTDKLSNKELLNGVAYMSDQTHLCVEQGLHLCGFSKQNIRKIPVDSNFRIRTDLLAQTIEQDRAAGLHPFLLVANAGTANTGAVDNLLQTARIARNYNLWFHVDAAYGGFFLLTKQGQTLMKGIEQADSLVLDPHKSLFLPYGTGGLLVNDKTKLLNAFTFTGSYLPPTQKQKATDPLLDDIMNLSQEVSRDFRGFRIWLPLKMLGVKPFREQLEEKLKLTRWVTDQLQQIPNLRIVAPPQLSVVTFKLEPTDFDVSDEELDQLNKNFLDAINRRGNIFLSPFKSKDNVIGEFALRMAILSHRTKQEHLRQGVSDIQSAVEETLSGSQC